MKQYDYIIVGGGLSGMILAFFLSNSSLNNKRVVIIEKNKPGSYHREWSYWINHLHAFEPVVQHRWKNMCAHFSNQSFEFPLHDYEMQLIRSKELFKYINDTISNNSNFEHVYQAAERISEHTNEGEVVADNETYNGE